MQNTSMDGFVRTAALVVLGLGLVATPAWSQPGGFPLLFTVGADGSCTHTTLAGALAAAAAAGPENDFIRVARNHQDTDIAVNIVNQSVTIEGGFDDCGDSTASGVTELVGMGPGTQNDPSDSVIEMFGGSAATRYAVVLRSLEITNGGNDEDDGEGGGIEIDGGYDVRLENVDVTSNEAAAGGGIHIDGLDGATLVLDDATTLILNDGGSRGGGLFCQGAASVFFLDGAIAFNEAIIGGGVDIGPDCFFQSEAGGLLQGIYLNNAIEIGGGIDVFGGTAVLEGSASRPASVYNNTSGEPGGGISLSGGAFVARNAWINSNTAGTSGNGAGGGVYMSSGVLVMERTLGSDCHTPDRCSSLSGNIAVRGGGIFVGGGNATLRQTYVEQNSAVGSAVVVEDPLAPGGANLLVEGSILADNVGSHTVIARGNASVTLGFTTLTGNDSIVSAISVEGTNFGTASAQVFSSILYEDSEPILSIAGPSTSATFDCNIVHEIASLVNATRVEIGNPAFVDAANGDYHLAHAGSAAIDHCDTSSFVPGTTDIDLQARGFDQPIVADSFPPSPFDAGADENHDTPLAMPEPSSGLAGGAGLLLVVWLARRRSSRKARPLEVRPTPCSCAT